MFGFLGGVVCCFCGCLWWVVGGVGVVLFGCRWCLWAGLVFSFSSFGLFGVVWVVLSGSFLTTRRWA
ncbi:hypothetical protein RA265_28195, partial [Pseudomonas syringae pv. tagetis]|uniref:hypothetical protein n=1 Tax=Pseudomonas syringae group genomosp. 7 TaxID=251699 RepID=UPI0037701867